MLDLTGWEKVVKVGELVLSRRTVDSRALCWSLVLRDVLDWISSDENTFMLLRMSNQAKIFEVHSLVGCWIQVL